jgi:Polyketide cyclase / dehydrase and lipid transport
MFEEKRNKVMSRIQVKAVAVLNARAEDVYSTLADYRNGHPLIVPPEVFFDFQVEQGGYGAGTVLRFKMKVLGTVRELYQRVSEPEPGRVLVERDIESKEDAITTFTVDPVDDGQKARVEIETNLIAPSGLIGLIQGIMLPLINKSIYQKELKNLEAFAQRKQAASV